MKFYDRTWPAFAVVERMQKIARRGLFDGTHRTLSYLEDCKGFDYQTGAVLLFSRDTGHHTSGWWKNPDFERCLHLSISFRLPVTGMPEPFDRKKADKWAKQFFGDDLRHAWIEPPAFAVGKAHEVWHYRVFCDEYWRAIRPRGEVYSRELTEAGWKSFSELEAEREAAATADHFSGA